MMIPSMTDDEVGEFLREQKVMRLVTISPGGKPHLVAMWYNLINGDIYFSTASNSRKARNISASNRLSIIVDAGEEFGSIKGVVINGRTEVVTDEDLISKYGELSVSKYWGSPDNPILKRYQQMPVERTLFKVIPDKIRSWDYSKIGR